MSFKAEVIADNSEKWVSNALVFATAHEADLYGSELMSRWMAVREYRVTEVSEDANYIFDEVKYKAEPLKLASGLVARTS